MNLDPGSWALDRDPAIMDVCITACILYIVILRIISDYHNQSLVHPSAAEEKEKQRRIICLLISLSVYIYP